LEPDHPYVSRGGLKLAAALDAFALDAAGMVCADLGCNVGGFTDCLLQRGAAKVYAVDTGYGSLAWKLRQDPRVVVLERSNALHLDPASLSDFTRVDLACIDLGWTRQAHAIPAALRWLGRDERGRIVTLIKPHYEADAGELRRGGRRGVLSDEQAEVQCQRVLEQLPALGVRVLGRIRSPIRGGKGKGRAGNIEYLALLAPSVDPA
jgi:23S rRNA (cytidine1920-2'-O)/16S rRNA (cytidine1409-2'-O)-methyltransferase